MQVRLEPLAFCIPAKWFYKCTTWHFCPSGASYTLYILLISICALPAYSISLFFVDVCFKFAHIFVSCTYMLDYYLLHINRCI